jgi:homospermidine synthase
MSHFSRIQTQLTEQTYLLKALQDMGCKVIDNGILRAIGGMTLVKAEIVTHLPGSGRMVGFVRQGDHYTIVADWWGVSTSKREEFKTKLTQRYAYHAAVDKLQEQGFSIAREESAQDGQVHLTLRRMA